MARHKFTATHGVALFADGGVWADFARSNVGEPFTFETDDDEVAERLRAVDLYGIEATTPAPAPAKHAAQRRRR